MSIILGLLPTIAAFALTLLNSGTGSGKSRMLRAAADNWHATYRAAAVSYLIAPNAMIGEQLLTEFASWVEPFKVFRIADYAKASTLEAKVREALDKGHKVLIYSTGVRHRDGELTLNTEKLVSVMEKLKSKRKRQLILIDELHVALTALVGGMNPVLNHKKKEMEHYGKVCAQKYSSLNFFDTCRELDAHVLACSATMNNVICSKLATTGYNPTDMQTWNLFPIESLYSELRCKAVDVHDFNVIAPYLEAAERGDGKILLVFPAIDDKKIIVEGVKMDAEQASIQTFERDYLRHFGRPMPATVKVTCRENLTDLDDGLKDAKYVMGVNLLGTGFDISTHVSGASFSLGILCRAFSDKLSQPLSSITDHKLRVEMSAALAQALGRMRRGGLFLVPLTYEGITLYDLQCKVSDAIHAGHVEYQTYYMEEELQAGRFHHTLLNALIHHSQVPDFGMGRVRKTVLEVLYHLHELTGRRFEKEVVSREQPFCMAFWKRAVGALWDIYLEEHCARPKGEKRNDDKITELLRRDRAKMRTGSGYDDGRDIDLLVKTEVKERSGGRCCHCGRSDMPEEEWQVCHFKRHAAGGPYVLDNLGWGHRACDAAFDGRFLIYNMRTLGSGYWLHPNCASYRPSAWQRSFISEAYIDHRWAEHKAALCTEGDFRPWLTANGWVHHDF